MAMAKNYRNIEFDISVKMIKRMRLVAERCILNNDSAEEVAKAMTYQSGLIIKELLREKIQPIIEEKEE